MDLINTTFPEQSKNETIKYIKKQEYESYYSTKNKWPYLVIERLSMSTGNPGEGQEKIKRDEVEDPFSPDPSIPESDSFTKEDYAIMMAHGLSPGHNAPAGHHYTSPEIWSETFSYANICPQEMVFNSGIWVIIENWCKYISKQQKYRNFTNLRVFTGSIPNPDGETVLKLNDSEVSVNIPTHMFKLVCARSKDTGNENKIFITCFICPNKPIDPLTTENQNIMNWTVPISTLEKMSNIDFTSLLDKFYGYKKENKEFVNMHELTPIEFNLNDIFKKQMIKSLWYGIIIYSKTKKQLETAWNKCQQALNGEKLDYHKEFYNLILNKLSSNGSGNSNNNNSSVSGNNKSLLESSSKLSLVDDTELEEKESMVGIRNILGIGVPPTKKEMKINEKMKNIDFFGLFKKGGTSKNKNQMYKSKKNNTKKRIIPKKE
jgi:DNA/RNA endonuclease G (NUC1)